MTRRTRLALAVSVLAALALPLSLSASAGPYDSYVEWARALNAMHVNTIGVAGDGSIYTITCGREADILAVPTPPAGSTTTVLAKFTPAGEMLWSKVLPVNNPLGYDQYGRYLNLYVNRDGSMLIACDPVALFDPPETFLPSYGQALLVRLDPSGNVIWQKRVPGAPAAYRDGMIVIIDGTYVAVQGTQPAILVLDDSGRKIRRTPFGGWGSEEVIGACLDGEGNLLVFGTTSSPDFPLLNPFDSTWCVDRPEIPVDRAGEFFVIKFDSTGNICWSSFLGGSSYEGRAVWDWATRTFIGFGGWACPVVDDEGNFYVCGATNSDDFPLVNPFDSTFGVLGESFVAKITSDGRLAWSTFYDQCPYPGCNQPRPEVLMDLPLHLVPDRFGNLYVASDTWSSFLPLVGDFAMPPTDQRWGGNTLVLFDPEGNVRWSTYYCHKGVNVWPQASDDGGLLITGAVSTDDFLQRFPFQPRGGSQDAFICQVSPWGSFFWSSYVGGEGDERNSLMSPCGSRSVYLAGSTRSKHWPTEYPNPPEHAVRCYLMRVSRSCPTEFAVLTRGFPKSFVGLPYSAAIELAGDNPPFFMSMTDGALPDGLSLDTSTGAITGTPSRAGRYGFTIQAHDSFDPARVFIAPLAILVAADFDPPAVSELAAPAVVRERLDTTLTFSAVADDTGLGNSLITAVEYFIDSAGPAGAGIPMTAADGAFDSVSESVGASIDTSAWRSPGAHRLFVRARDETGRWGSLASLSFDVIDVIPPGTVSDLSIDFSCHHETAATADWRLSGLPDASCRSLTIDLGSAKPVVGVSLTPYDPFTYFPRAFSVWLSSDGLSWSCIARQADWKPVRKLDSFWQCELAQARYVKIEAVPLLDKRAKTWSLAVGGIKVLVTNPANPVAIRWTAPDEDGSTDANPVAEYSLGIGFDFFGAPLFDSLEPVAAGAPKPAGQAEELSVTLGPRFGRLWAALKSRDSDSNWSALSNVAEAYVLPYGFMPDTPLEGFTVSRLAVSQFGFLRGPGLKSVKIAFSDRPDFPNRPIRGEEFTSKTVRFPIKLTNSWWKAAPSQWKALMKLADNSGRLYWRAEGKTLSNSVVIGPTRSVSVPAP